MEPCYFGPAGHLFGIFHPAAQAPGSGAALLVQPPLLECMRVHFAVREVAKALAAQGVDVLRFDLTACGDSHGKLATVTLDQWVTDIESAKHHLEAMSDQKRYVVLGVRFSAGLLLGARVARPWSRMVLWDPILDGNAWIRAQREMRDSVQASYADDPADLSGERASEALLQSAATFKAPVAMADEVHVIRTHSSSQGRPEWRYTDVDYDCRWGCATLNNLFAHTVVRSIATVMML